MRRPRTATVTMMSRVDVKRILGLRWFATEWGPARAVERLGPLTVRVVPCGRLRMLWYRTLEWWQTRRARGASR